MKKYTVRLTGKQAARFEKIGALLNVKAEDVIKAEALSFLDSQDVRCFLECWGGEVHTYLTKNRATRDKPGVELLEEVLEEMGAPLARAIGYSTDWPTFNRHWARWRRKRDAAEKEVVS